MIDPQTLAQKAENLKASLERNDISQQEFKELVNDLIVLETINNDAMNLEENIQYREIIVGVIDLASMIV